jgi:hypothetical membrane protein
MTQLARPDLARSRSALGHLRPRPAAGGPAVPGWALLTALLAPAVLVAGWLIAGGLQPGAYSPMRETISVLAGYTGAERWVMTTALLLVGSCQIATGAGLAAVRAPARALLILTGLCMVGIAANPELATGPTTRHLAFAVSCDVTTAVWPLLVARRAPAPSWILSVRGCVTVTVLFAGLSGWLLVAAQNGAGDLGMVERLTSAVQGLFPFVVALALWRAARDAGNQGQRALGLPAKFAQAGVVDAEVVGDLVDDGPADLVGDLVLGLADRADRLVVDGDPVGQDPRVAGCPAGQRDALVEAKQPGRPRTVLDRDGDIAHQPPEALRQPVKGRGDHLFEALRVNLDHPSIVHPAPRCRRRVRLDGA